MRDMYKTLGLSWSFIFSTASFLIPYVICLVFCGIPIFYLEVALGQYVGKGVVKSWSAICPLFGGKCHLTCHLSRESPKTEEVVEIAELVNDDLFPENVARKDESLQNCENMTWLKSI